MAVGGGGVRTKGRQTKGNASLADMIIVNLVKSVKNFDEKKSSCWAEVYEKYFEGRQRSKYSSHYIHKTKTLMKKGGKEWIQI